MKISWPALILIILGMVIALRWRGGAGTGCGPGDPRQVAGVIVGMEG
jgi:hypothetical protein